VLLYLTRRFLQGQKPGFRPDFDTGTSDMLIAVAENYEMTSFANYKTEMTCCCCCRRLETFINMELIFQDYIDMQTTQEPYFMFYICTTYFVTNFIHQVTRLMRCQRAHRNLVL